MAKVKVVLRQRVEKLGEAGDVTTVAAGFARNYLIPRGLAVAATKGNLKQSESWRKARQERVSKELVAIEDVRGKLEAGPLRVTAQAGPDGRLFGSITAAQIVDSIKAALQIEIDRHDVHLDEPIRHLGFHEVQVRLHPEVSARVTMEVVEA
jgi:large subunit ribosomal protein L9